MRVSSYIVRVTLEDGRSLLVHTYTGAADLVEAGVARFFDALGAEDTDHVAGLATSFGLASQDVETLTKRGYLTDKTQEEEREKVAGLAAVLHRQATRHVGGVIIPTYDCNLRCTYCYERRIREHGRAWLARTMTPEMVDKAYAMLERALASAKGRPQRLREVTLLGGEPLLAKNRDIVLYILAQGAARGYSFSVISNGTELDAFLPELAQYNVGFVQITLDGLGITHDRRRFGPRGEASFGRIASNIRRALDAGLRVSIRVNVDITNLADLPQLADLAVTEGWPTHSGFSMYCAPVYTKAGKCGLDDSVALSEAQLARTVADLQARFPSMSAIQNSPSVERTFVSLFRTGEYLQFKGHFCAATGSMHIFDPHGDIYVCWDSVGQAVGKIGTYSPMVSYDERNLENWWGRVVTSIPACSSCKYALLCGGGCPQHAYNATKSFRAPDCRDFQQILEAGLPIFYRKSLQARIMEQHQQGAQG